MTTPEQLQALATRMGLTAVLDASGGYGVVRVVVNRGGRAEVFDPANDAEQAMAVLCWFLSGDVFREVNRADVWCAMPDGEIMHANTPTSLRAAILAAALRVAGET